MKRTVRIVVHRFGDVEDRFVEKVSDIMNECYDRIDARDVKIVDLCLFDRSSRLNTFLSAEKKSLGIELPALEISYHAVHDAWRGTPRIMVAYDRMLLLPELVRAGCLRHEVAHTILHGSLEFYSFYAPTFLLKLVGQGIVSRQTVRSFLYLVSVAVKDYEATRLLYRNRFVKDQVAYNKYILEPSREDLEGWDLAKNNKSARLLVLTSVLKTACSATPLVKDERYGLEINSSLSKSMSYLPEEWAARLSKLLELAIEFGENTHENVNLFTKKIVQELLNE